MWPTISTALSPDLCPAFCHLQHGKVGYCGKLGGGPGNEATETAPRLLLLQVKLATPFHRFPLFFTPSLLSFSLPLSLPFLFTMRKARASTTNSLIMSTSVSKQYLGVVSGYHGNSQFVLVCSYSTRLCPDPTLSQENKSGNCCSSSWLCQSQQSRFFKKPMTVVLLFHWLTSNICVC